MKGECEGAAEDGGAGAEERDVVAEAAGVDGAKGGEAWQLLAAEHEGGHADGEGDCEEREDPVVGRWRRKRAVGRGGRGGPVPPGPSAVVIRADCKTQEAKAETY